MCSPQLQERLWVCDARCQTIRRLFEAGHSIEEIAAAACVRYEVILAIVRP
jgi:hypothetical protein